ncbi:MAG: hypothetical protein F2842_00905 [Actinobacteria bacterium]|uniref:Unannotated protein n=1 Tax=freshwater metagenome TaxID=449393 RepID=A0A6J7IG98_9ZZZZ|nr:hypothetical protein [Actinomycetota bacterium]MSW40751.1 hypothetical protein [Actinomycetota bacterium]
MALTYTEVVGVYHADGGLRGELAYVVGKLMGRAHCSLCDITHSPVRRKAEWDAFAARLSIPFSLLHLNELTPELAEAVDGRSPVVLGRRDERWLRLMEPHQLDSLGGSVTAFESELSRALESA